MRFWLRLFTACAAALILQACSSGPGPVDNRPYEEQMAAWRQAKDEAFRETGANSTSPIPEAQRAKFTGLTYFPIDQTYRVPAVLALERSDNPQIFRLRTTGPEKERRMPKVGTLTFTIQGQPHSLIAFASEGSLTQLFVPFADLTNGSETYRGGRYLDIDQTSTNIYDLDFNRATNPYCVYNPNYDCPLPPRENRLTVAIRAGEKLPPAHEP